VRSRVRFAGTYLLLGLQVPNVHLSTQIPEPAKTNEAVQVSPYNFVFMLLTELEDNLVLLIEKHRFSGHEPTDHQIDLSSLIPSKVMQGP
jgi:hypothetical protein